MTAPLLAAADEPPQSPGRLRMARERLAPPKARRAPIWPALLAALGAATAAMAAAAAVILGGPALGAASGEVHPPVSHLALP